MRIFKPLESKPMALLWGGLSLSALGDELYGVALGWIGVRVLGGDAGYLSAFQALVVLLAVLVIGRWADRLNPQRAMIGADLARAAVLIMVVTLWLAAGAPSVILLAVAIVALSIGEAVFEPALQVVMPPLVDDRALLPAANSLLDATERGARLLGPGLVALLAGVFPVVHFLTLDAISFLASAAALLLIRRLGSREPTSRPPVREPIWGAVARGLRAIRGHTLLHYALLTSGLLNGAWYAAFYLGLPLFIERFDVRGPGDTGVGAFGLVLSAYGCTNLAANMVLGSRVLPARPQFQMFLGDLVVGSGIIMLALAACLPHAWLLAGLAAAAALGAIGGPMKDIPVAVLRQTRLTPADIPAAMRVSMAASSAGKLAAMLLAPSVLARVGVVSAILICGAVLIVIGGIGLFRYAGWTESVQ